MQAQGLLKWGSELGVPSGMPRSCHTPLRADSKGYGTSGIADSKSPGGSRVPTDELLPSPMWARQAISLDRSQSCSRLLSRCDASANYLFRSVSRSATGWVVVDVFTAVET